MDSENREDYLINILRLTENGERVRTSKLASYMNVAPASVTEMLRVLAEAGYVDYVKYQGVRLTPEGQLYARNIRRKHHVIERFLTDILGLTHEEAHAQAGLMEHAISDDSINRLCRLAGTKIDHDCTTCDNPCDNVITFDNTAQQMVPGEKGSISHLKSEDPSLIKGLISMGFVPGQEIELVSTDNGSRVFSLNGETIAISDESSSAICI